MSKTSYNSNIIFPRGKIGNISLDMIYRGEKTLGQFKKYWNSAYQASYDSLPQDWGANITDCLTKFNLQIGETNYNAAFSKTKCNSEVSFGYEETGLH